MISINVNDDLWANHHQYRLQEFDLHVQRANSVIDILNKYSIGTTQMQGRRKELRALMVQEVGFDRNVSTEMAMERIFGSCESFFVTNTLQYDDCSKYVAPPVRSGGKEGTA